MKKLQSLNDKSFDKLKSNKVENLQGILGGETLYAYATASGTQLDSGGGLIQTDNAWWTDSDNDPMNGGYELDDIADLGEMPDIQFMGMPDPPHPGTIVEEASNPAELITF